MPIVADIHIHYKRAIEAAVSGARCLRINPGNIGSKEKIRETRTALLVEGQGDVWRMHEAGLINTVGMFGSSLSDAQARILETSGALNIVVRGQLWPIVTEPCALQNVEELHQRLENGLVVGRAAVLINP